MTTEHDHQREECPHPCAGRFGPVRWSMTARRSGGHGSGTNHRSISSIVEHGQAALAVMAAAVVAGKGTTYVPKESIDERQAS